MTLGEWDIVVAGSFLGNGRQQILLYDRAGGTGDVVGFDNSGKTNLDHSNTGWRNSWDVIVAGSFIGNSQQQILLYDHAGGTGDIVVMPGDTIGLSRQATTT